LAAAFALRAPQQEMDMRKLTLTLLAGAGTLIASSAYAADEIQIGDSSPLLQQVRLVVTTPANAGIPGVIVA
jgi:hypothetical protein